MACCVCLEQLTKLCEVTSSTCRLPLRFFIVRLETNDLSKLYPLDVASAIEDLYVFFLYNNYNLLQITLQVCQTLPNEYSHPYEMPIGGQEQLNCFIVHEPLGSQKLLEYQAELFFARNGVHLNKLEYCKCYCGLRGKVLVGENSTQVS